MELEKISAFRKELAVAETFDDLKYVESKASAIAEFARVEKVSKSTQDEVGAFRCDIEAKKGAWLDEYFPAFTGKKIIGFNSRTLKDEGINKH